MIINSGYSHKSNGTNLAKLIVTSTNKDDLSYIYQQV